MAEHREIFRKGAQEGGLTIEKADEIFDLMEKFAGYGFNKSHAAAYALLSYHTAYLKHHHTAAFMAANMSLAMDDTEKVKILVEDSITGAEGGGSIIAGYGVNGGDILGNIVAEGDINEVVAWGDIGRADHASVIFSGGVVYELQAGNPINGIDPFGGTRSPLYTSTFGDLYANVYEGGQSADGSPDIHLGGSIKGNATVIIGARNEEQLRQNLAAVGWNLTAEQVKKLDEASCVTKAYPYWHQAFFK